MQALTIMLSEFDASIDHHCSVEDLFILTGAEPEGCLTVQHT